MHAYTSIDVNFIFDSACLLASLGVKGFQFWKYSSNSRCHLSSCLLAGLAMFFTNSLPISYS